MYKLISEVMENEGLELKQNKPSTESKGGEIEFINERAEAIRNNLVLLRDLWGLVAEELKGKKNPNPNLKKALQTIEEVRSNNLDKLEKIEPYLTKEK